MCFAQPACGAGAIICVVGRHAHVDDREVGKLGVDCLDEGRRVGRLGDNLVIGVFEQPRQALAEECGVLADYDAHGRIASTVVPPFWGLETNSVPPCAPTRSARRASPEPSRCSAPPTPSSSMRT